MLIFLIIFFDVEKKSKNFQTFFDLDFFGFFFGVENFFGHSFDVKNLIFRFMRFPGPSGPGKRVFQPGKDFQDVLKSVISALLTVNALMGFEKVSQIFGHISENLRFFFMIAIFFSELDFFWICIPIQNFMIFRMVLFSERSRHSFITFGSVQKNYSKKHTFPYICYHSKKLRYMKDESIKPHILAKSMNFDTKSAAKVAEVL